MVNFQNGKIYSIRSHQTDQVYIGSTTQTLAQRLGKHRCTYRRWKNSVGYMGTTSKEILKYDDYYIELVEMYPCNNKDELHKREGEIIRATPNCVNKIIAGRTSKEYREDNREIIQQKKKEYAEKNKESIKQYKKEYAEKNKESIAKKKKEYAEKNKERIRQKSKEYYEKNKESIAKKSKEYIEKNKEKIKQYKKEYAEKNKDIIKQKHSKKVICECGAEIRKYHLPRHKKSKKHQFYQQTYDFIHA
jgi:hypothetical protein